MKFSAFVKITVLRAPPGLFFFHSLPPSQFRQDEKNQFQSTVAPIRRLTPRRRIASSSRERLLKRISADTLSCQELFPLEGGGFTPIKELSIRFTFIFPFLYRRAVIDKGSRKAFRYRKYRKTVARRFSFLTGACMGSASSPC